MIWLYVAALVFGAVFVVPMVLGGLDFDADVGELDVDADFDVDADVDPGSADGAGSGGFGGAIGDFVGSLLNFRSMVLGATFFGLSGVVLGAFDTGRVTALVTAIVLGLVAAGANSALTNYVIGRQQSSHVTMREVSGASATVLLPISAERRGRVRALIAGQTEYFTALPHRIEHSFETGESVVVIEVVDGIAKVASLKELEP